MTIPRARGRTLAQDDRSARPPPRSARRLPLPKRSGHPSKRPLLPLHLPTDCDRTGANLLMLCIGTPLVGTFFLIVFNSPPAVSTAAALPPGHRSQVIGARGSGV
jgi:hypothetical protein